MAHKTPTVAGPQEEMEGSRQQFRTVVPVTRQRHVETQTQVVWVSPHRLIHLVWNVTCA